MSDRQIDVIVSDLTQMTERMAKKLALDITANLIETTPIDTGWARSNWLPSIGSPILYTVGSRGSVSASQQSANTAALLGWKLEQGAIFISNNVPYITKLNEGSSQQAPAGFIQAAIDKAIFVDARSGEDR